MDVIFPIAVGLGIAAAIIFPQEAKIRLDMRKTDTGAGAVSAPDKSQEVREILGRVYTEMRKRGVYVYVPWVRDCIEEMDGGGVCLPEVAIAALVETGEDLNGTRWDTDDLALVFEDATKKLLALI